jgi:hypothetical protein
MCVPLSGTEMTACTTRNFNNDCTEASCVLISCGVTGNQCVASSEFPLGSGYYCQIYQVVPGLDCVNAEQYPALASIIVGCSGCYGWAQFCHDVEAPSCGYKAQEQQCNATGTAWVNTANSNVCTAASQCSPPESEPVCGPTVTPAPTCKSKGGDCYSTCPANYHIATTAWSGCSAPSSTCCIPNDAPTPTPPHLYLRNEWREMRN